MLKVLIVDDEKDALEVLEWKLNSYVSDLEIVLSSSPKKALDLVVNYEPDIVFLDIQMPKMDGFQFLENLATRNFQLIFTTAYDQFALPAIRHEVVAYLLKPVDKKELLDAVAKAKINIAKQNVSERFERILHSMKTNETKVSVSADGRIYFLEPREVVMLQSDKSYTTIFLDSGKNILVSKTLKEVEKKFTFDNFYRVHNSYLINLNHVKEYLKKDGGELVLSCGLSANVSRTKKIELLKKLELYAS